MDFLLVPVFNCADPFFTTYKITSVIRSNYFRFSSPGNESMKSGNERICIKEYGQHVLPST